MLTKQELDFVIEAVKNWPIDIPDHCWLRPGSGFIEWDEYSFIHRLDEAAEYG